MRDTVGKLSIDLLKKPYETRDPIELEREMHKDYEKNILECIDRGKKEIPGNFYVVVETKKERSMQNVVRNYFFYRQSCPTPTTDQTVYHYFRGEDRVEFLWVIPSNDTCMLLRDHALEVVENERGLLQYVLDFYDGTLLLMARKLNGENLKTGIILEKETHV